MGDEISHVDFTKEECDVFKHRLKQETEQLSTVISESKLEDSGLICGLELEAWLLDHSMNPLAVNEGFLRGNNHPLVTSELAQYNIELNSTPRAVKGKIFRDMHAELTESWAWCIKRAKTLDAEVLAIGTLPTLTHEHLVLAYMSPMNRYIALNRELLKLRNNKPLTIDIKGRERLQITHDDIMLEAATTSLQIHLQVDPKKAVRYYNAASIASSIMVGISANSPYMFGKDLWDETRIATFEQSVDIPSFCGSNNAVCKRVTFGKNYIDNIIDPFNENIDCYPVLLPEAFATDDKDFKTLRLHNGTIWRWNRPLVGVNETSNLSLRIEHRVVSAGPTLIDTVANIIYFVGLMEYLVDGDIPAESLIPFNDAKANFYHAARDGLDASIIWSDGMSHNLKTLLLEKINSKVREFLLKAGIDKADIVTYFDEVMCKRIESSQTGCQWQRNFIAKYGNDFHQMTRRYHENAQADIAVHAWEI